MKNTSLFYSVAGFAALSAVASSCQQKQEEQKKYNIVYIMTDDHTAQMMSCYDTRYMETPNLDRIAADGVRFTNSFVANSLSGPSRACMITGKHSCANKFYDNTTCVFDSAQQTFPKLLQKAGYQTALVGKWHLESLPTGFNYWEIVPGQGDYYNPDFITQNNDTVHRHGYITNLITDDAIDWMENGRDKSKPFCLLIHHKAIHRNWMADTCHLNLYEDKTFPLPETFFDDYEGRPAAAAQEMSIVKDMDMIYDLKMLRPDKQSRLKTMYERFLGRMDEAQRAAWDKFYGPVIEDFYKKNPQGKELAEKILNELTAVGLNKRPTPIYSKDTTVNEKYPDGSISDYYSVQICAKEAGIPGIIVEHAENGKRAVEMVEQNPEGYFDAIVMDIRMPVMSGLEAARQIRAMSRTDAQTVPIIAMTANAYEEDVSQSLAAGMNAHLAKPIEPQVILDTLAGYIGSKN